MYSHVVVDYRPVKTNSYLTSLTVSCNRINYPSNCGTPTIDRLTVKLLVNSVVSKPSARFMSINIKDFYHDIPMSRYK